MNKILQIIYILVVVTLILAPGYHNALARDFTKQEQ